jgi:hypothetical protein
MHLKRDNGSGCTHAPAAYSSRNPTNLLNLVMDLVHNCSNRTRWGAAQAARRQGCCAAAGKARQKGVLFLKNTTGNMLHNGWAAGGVKQLQKKHAATEDK